MPEKRQEFSLDAVRTDGWFERIGDGIGSFQALCDIVGEAFFAFSMITGARITALTVDRRNPDNTLVDFVIAAPGDDESDAEVQRLTLADFRHRLVGALLTDDAMPPAPERDTDVEALQLHIGVRYLLPDTRFGGFRFSPDVTHINSFENIPAPGAEPVEVVGTYDRILSYVVSVDFIWFALTGAALFVFRKRDADGADGFRAPGHPVTTGLFVLACAAVVVATVASSPVNSAIGFGILLAGIPAFLYWRAKR